MQPPPVPESPPDSSSVPQHPGAAVASGWRASRMGGRVDASMLRSLRDRHAETATFLSFGALNMHMADAIRYTATVCDEVNFLYFAGTVGVVVASNYHNALRAVTCLR